MRTPRTRKAALALLGVDEAALLTVPHVTPHLEHVMAGLRQRSLPSDIFYYLNASAEADARKVLQVYYSVKPSQRARIPLEAFCAAASVDPHSILNAVVSTVDRLNRLNATLRISSAQPDIVGKTVDMAMKDEGHADRVLYMKAAGLLPTPKGAQTLIQVTQNASANASPQVAVVTAPPPEHTIRRLSERLNAARGLPALPAQVAEPFPEAVQQREDAVLVEAQGEDEDDQEI